MSGLYVRVYVCLCVCAFQLKVQSICVVPLLILSQNGCCQADKLSNGALMGRKGKVIHNCGLLGPVAINMKS